MNAQDKNLEPSAEAAPGREDAPGYTIPALVRHDAGTMPSLGWPNWGDVIHVREGLGIGPNWDMLGKYYAFDEADPANPFPFVPGELILYPTPEQVTEERALIVPKPSPAAQAAPEPSLGEGSKDELIKALRDMLELNAALARACADRVDITQDHRPAAAWAALAKAEAR